MSRSAILTRCGWAGWVRTDRVLGRLGRAGQQCRRSRRLPSRGGLSSRSSSVRRHVPTQRATCDRGIERRHRGSACIQGTCLPQIPNPNHNLQSRTPTSNLALISGTTTDSHQIVNDDVHRARSSTSRAFCRPSPTRASLPMRPPRPLSTWSPRRTPSRTPLKACESIQSILPSSTHRSLRPTSA